MAWLKVRKQSWGFFLMILMIGKENVILQIQTCIEMCVFYGVFSLCKWTRSILEPQNFNATKKDA